MDDIERWANALIDDIRADPEGFIQRAPEAQREKARAMVDEILAAGRLTDMVYGPGWKLRRKKRDA